MKTKRSIAVFKTNTKNVIKMEALNTLKGGIDEWGCYERLPHDEYVLELMDEIDE